MSRKRVTIFLQSKQTKDGLMHEVSITAGIKSVMVMDSKLSERTTEMAMALSGLLECPVEGALIETKPESNNNGGNHE